MISYVKDILQDDFWIMPQTPEYIENGIPYITSKNIKNGKIDFGKVNYISKESFEQISKNRPILQGDILISMIGTLGETAEVTEADGVFYGQNMFLIRLDESKVDKRYFLNYFKSNFVTRALAEKQNQSTQKYLKANHIEDLQIPTPPLVQQENIARTLDKISELINYRKQQLQQLDELVKARFVELFGDPVTNPNNLPVISLGDLSELITKGASPSWQGYSYTDDSSQTLFVTSENVREGYMDLTTPKYIEDGFNEKQRRSVIRKGDFLINIVGASIGRAAQFNLECKANINQAAALVRIKDKRVRDKYLLTYLNSDKAQLMYNSMKSDTGRANLSLQDIASLSILLPSIEQQIYFEKIVEQIDKSKFEVQQSLEKLETLKKSLMQQYFG